MAALRGRPQPRPGTPAGQGVALSAGVEATYPPTPQYAPTVPSPRRYDAVLFDFSGVMIDSAFTAIAKIGGDAGADQTLELLLGPYDRDTDHPWHRVERGEIPITDWVTEVSEQADVTASPSTSVSSAASSPTPTCATTWSPRCSPCGPTATAPRWSPTTCARRPTRGARCSPSTTSSTWSSTRAASGCASPTPHLPLALEQLGDVSPARAVFLDDHPGNVAGAERAGLAAVLVDDPAVAIAELRELLGRTLADGAELPAPPGA